MRRRESWPEDLAAFLGERESAPFAWGSNDCGQFALQAIAAITGIEAAPELRNAYDSEFGAGRAMMEYAGGGIEEAVAHMAEQNGFDEIPIAFAQRGDIVILQTPFTDAKAAGIVDMDGIRIATVSTSGFVRTSKELAIRAWRVA